MGISLLSLSGENQSKYHCFQNDMYSSSSVRDERMFWASLFLLLSFTSIKVREKHITKGHGTKLDFWRHSHLREYWSLSDCHCVSAGSLWRDKRQRICEKLLEQKWKGEVKLSWLISASFTWHKEACFCPLKSTYNASSDHFHPLWPLELSI